MKEACIIPIIGNGDINTPQDIIDMRAQTNCDGFMIGRGARGNPWIFRDMKYYYEHGELPDKPDIYEVKDMMLRHARLMVEFKGEYTGIHEMRKHVAWYSVGMYDSAKLRSNVNQVDWAAPITPIGSYITSVCCGYFPVLCSRWCTLYGAAVFRIQSASSGCRLCRFFLPPSMLYCTSIF